MSKTKSITDLVTELQNENESLKGLKKDLILCVKPNLATVLMSSTVSS